MTTHENGDQTVSENQTAERCRNVLHIDWEADPVPVREDLCRCVLPRGHAKRHEGKDQTGSWFRW